MLREPPLQDGGELQVVEVEQGGLARGGQEVARHGVDANAGRALDGGRGEAQRHGGEQLLGEEVSASLRGVEQACGEAPGGETAGVTGGALAEQPVERRSGDSSGAVRLGKSRGSVSAQSSQASAAAEPIPRGASISVYSSAPLDPARLAHERKPLGR